VVKVVASDARIWKNSRSFGGRQHGNGKEGVGNLAWIATSDLARSPGHPFYERLNQLLAEHGFDAFVEEQCRSFYAERMGRPSLPPGCTSGCF
jgi:hypothetical protein